MSRRNHHRQAEMAASEAGRVLQAQRNSEPAPEAEVEKKSEAPETKAPTPEKNPRTIALEEIAASRQAEEPKTEAPEEPKAEQKPEPKAETKVAQDTSPEAPAPDQQEQQPEAQAPAPVVVKQKVDGVEYEVSQAEIDEAGGERAWRINKAAQNRLEEAKQALAESRRTQAALAEIVQRTVAPPQPTLTDDQFIASKVDIIRFGTPEESAAALREVLQRSNKPVDQNAITAHVMNEMQKTQAVEKFKTEFQDVVTNPMVLRLAVALEQDRLPQLRNTQAPIDWGTFYRQIGNEVRTVMGKAPQPTVAAAPSGNPSQSEKEAKKASIVNLPTAAARAQLPEESKPESRQDILNEMKKKRGIPIG